ncbi:MAG TPA: radical SAM protein [bacterium]|nr:radical SAM protein [bacterium]
MEYIEVVSDKKIHGWWKGKRECSSERVLLNPYVGCEIGCFFCYTCGYPGKFQLSKKESKVFVYINFVDNLKKQIEKLNYISTCYLSPVSDPFQPAEKIFKITEKTIEFLISKNIPVNITTKETIPENIIEMIKGHPHCYGQVSILTIDENLRKKLMEKGAETDKLFENIRNLSKNNIFSICRIDPIIPFINDSQDTLEEIIKRSKDCGAKHIIASIIDINISKKEEIFTEIEKKFGRSIKRKLEELYIEKIGSSLHSKIDYRKNVFSLLRNLCDKYNLTFALCMEFEKKDGKIYGLNKEFGSSVNCEGINIPIYKRDGEKFSPACDCNGNCISCNFPSCGIEEIAQGKVKNNNYKGFDFYDYLRWSKKQKGLFEK